MRTPLSFALSTLVGLAAAMLALGCSCSSSPVRGHHDGGPGDDSGDNGMDGGPMDASRQDSQLVIPDAYIVPDPDAFFALDPPPMTCYPDGGMGPWPDPPGGTPECPDDRNREGCRCTDVGTTAPCWPGHRANRMRGICHDGTTTCLPRDEFGGVWGPCVGAVLPTPGVTRGPAACECFSAGRWAIDNLSPCFVGSDPGPYWAVSTYMSGGMVHCPTTLTTPPFNPEPGTDWSTDSLTVDCAGQFRLCYTLRAGDATMPHDTDCVVAESCVDTWYPMAGVTQPLPPLPSWTGGASSTCATQFATTGGYGEMSVQGTSIECNDVGDGSGGRYVFNRVNYCPLACNGPSPPAMCATCTTGGSGMF